MIQDYMFYIGLNKQASDFHTVSKFVINHICKTFMNGDDIANALEQNKVADVDSWRPMLKVSTSQDSAVKDQENEEFKLIFSVEVEAWTKWKEIYHSNVGHAYALIYEHCNRAMQSKLMARKEFDSKFKGHPIELLKAIKEHSVSYQETKYLLSSIADVIL